MEGSYLIILNFMKSEIGDASCLSEKIWIQLLKTVKIFKSPLNYIVTVEKYMVFLSF